MPQRESNWCNRVKTWLQFPQWFYLDIPVNTMVPPRLTPGGLATQYSSVGHFDLQPDQALVITLPVSDAPYVGFQLGSLWYISLDYINHQTSLNNTQAQADPDGKVRIVVSDQNPGVTNWVETLGHRRGFLQFRWQRVSRQLTEADGPTVELVDVDAVAATLPFFDHNKISEDDWRARIALRQQQIRQGCWDDRYAGRQGRGDQWCRVRARYHAGAPMCARVPTWCWRPAASNASMMLPSRSSIPATRRWRCEPTSPTTSRWPTSSTPPLEAYGKVDVLINNAFRVPSMKPLAGTSFQHIRDAIELSALGALRLIQGFTPALAESKGSIVNVNSMVIRHSQAKYGAYKMAKSALLSMSQSLATELGEQGIRVNSVAPGYIWGETLQGYFNHQAGKYGTTAEQIYQATAANSDLKRLPTEDEVASAILFMASDLSSGITGQTLDVNCGEYHT